MSEKKISVPVELHIVKRGRSLDKWFVTTWRNTHEKPEGWTLADFTPFIFVVKRGVTSRKSLAARLELMNGGAGVLAVTGCPRSEYEMWEEGFLSLGWEEFGTRHLTRAEAEDYQKRGAWG